MPEIQVIVSWSGSGREITRASVSLDGITQWLIELVIRMQRLAHSLDAATMRFGVEGSPFSTGPAGISALVHGTKMTNATDMELRISVFMMSRMNVCSVCRQESPEIPFTNCRFCGDTNAFHHGRCCTMNPHMRNHDI